MNLNTYIYGKRLLMSIIQQLFPVLSISDNYCPLLNVVTSREMSKLSWNILFAQYGHHLVCAYYLLLDRHTHTQCCFRCIIQTTNVLQNLQLTQILKYINDTRAI